MQRGDPGQGPYSQVRGCHKVEIQESTPPATLQTQDGLAVSPVRLSHTQYSTWQNVLWNVASGCHADQVSE